MAHRSRVSIVEPSGTHASPTASDASLLTFRDDPRSPTKGGEEPHASPPRTVSFSPTPSHGRRRSTVLRDPSTIPPPVDRHGRYVYGARAGFFSSEPKSQAQHGDHQAEVRVHSASRSRHRNDASSVSSGGIPYEDSQQSFRGANAPTIGLMSQFGHVSSVSSMNVGNWSPPHQDRLSPATASEASTPSGAHGHAGFSALVTGLGAPPRMEGNLNVDTPYGRSVLSVQESTVASDCGLLGVVPTSGDGHGMSRPSGPQLPSAYTLRQMQSPGAGGHSTFSVDLECSTGSNGVLPRDPNSQDRPAVGAGRVEDLNAGVGGNRYSVQYDWEDDAENVRPGRGPGLRGMSPQSMVDLRAKVQRKATTGGGSANRVARMKDAEAAMDCADHLCETPESFYHKVRRHVDPRTTGKDGAGNLLHSLRTGTVVATEEEESVSPGDPKIRRGQSKILRGRGLHEEDLDPVFSPDTKFGSFAYGPGSPPQFAASPVHDEAWEHSSGSTTPTRSPRSHGTTPEAGSMRRVGAHGDKGLDVMRVPSPVPRQSERPRISIAERAQHDTESVAHATVVRLTLRKVVFEDLPIPCIRSLVKARDAAGASFFMTVTVVGGAEESRSANVAWPWEYDRFVRAPSKALSDGDDDLPVDANKPLKFFVDAEPVPSTSPDRIRAAGAAGSGPKVISPAASPRGPPGQGFDAHQGDDTEHGYRPSALGKFTVGPALALAKERSKWIPSALEKDRTKGYHVSVDVDLLARAATLTELARRHHTASHLQPTGLPPNDPKDTEWWYPSTQVKVGLWLRETGHEPVSLARVTIDASSVFESAIAGRNDSSSKEFSSSMSMPVIASGQRAKMAFELVGRVVPRTLPASPPTTPVAADAPTSLPLHSNAPTAPPTGPILSGPGIMHRLSGGGSVVSESETPRSGRFLAHPNLGRDTAPGSTPAATGVFNVISTSMSAPGPLESPQGFGLQGGIAPRRTEPMSATVAPPVQQERPTAKFIRAPAHSVAHASIPTPDGGAFTSPGDRSPIEHSPGRDDASLASTIRDGRIGTAPLGDVPSVAPSSRRGSDPSSGGRRLHPVFASGDGKHVTPRRGSGTDASGTGSDATRSPRRSVGFGGLAGMGTSALSDSQVSFGPGLESVTDVPSTGAGEDTMVIGASIGRSTTASFTRRSWSRGKSVSEPRTGRSFRKGKMTASSKDLNKLITALQTATGDEDEDAALDRLEAEEMLREQARKQRLEEEEARIELDKHMTPEQRRVLYAVSARVEDTVKRALEPVVFRLDALGIRMSQLTAGIETAHDEAVLQQHSLSDRKL